MEITIGGGFHTDGWCGICQSPTSSVSALLKTILMRGVVYVTLKIFFIFLFFLLNS